MKASTQTQELITEAARREFQRILNTANLYLYFRTQMYIFPNEVRLKTAEGLPIEADYSFEPTDTADGYKVVVKANCVKEGDKFCDKFETSFETHGDRLSMTIPQCQYGFRR